MPTTAIKSQHGDYFNHDDQADGYDADVLDEGNPIRAGYREVLSWVPEISAVAKGESVLDLGCGTGNLSLLLPPFGRLVCVDISEKMLERARQKLSPAGGRCPRPGRVRSGRFIGLLRRAPAVRCRRQYLRHPSLDRRREEPPVRAHLPQPQPRRGERSSAI